MDIRDFLLGKTGQDPDFADDWEEVKDHILGLDKSFKSSPTDLILYSKTNKDTTQRKGYFSTTIDRDILDDPGFISYKAKHLIYVYVEAGKPILDLRPTEEILGADPGEGEEKEILLGRDSKFTDITDNPYKIRKLSRKVDMSRYEEDSEDPNFRFFIYEG